MRRRRRQRPRSRCGPSETDLSSFFSLLTSLSRLTQLSENILLGGMSAEPNCVWLKLVHATFLTEIRHNVARSEALLNECRGKSPSMTERFPYFL